MYYNKMWLRLRDLPLLIPFTQAAASGCSLFFSGTLSGMPVEEIPEEHTYLEGFISVSSALVGGRREIYSIQIRTGKDDGQIRHLESLARKARILVERVSGEVIDALAGGRTHGGVLARVGPYRFAEIEGLTAGARAPFIAMIDGVEDPFNFGSSVRALYAAGADGLVLRPRNWLSAAGVVARASAGTSEMIPTALCETAAEAAAHFRTLGLAVACATDERGSTSIYDADLTQPLFLLIGGEKRGITRSFSDSADLKLRIPYGRPMPHSLGTASATAIIAFELMRQRTAG